MGRHVQLEIERADLIEPAAVISLHRWKRRCSWDLCDEDFTIRGDRLGRRNISIVPLAHGLVLTNRLDALGGPSLFKRFE